MDFGPWPAQNLSPSQKKQAPTRRNANPKKVYCIDHAWVVSTSSGILVNSGHLLENLVFTALRRRHRAIYYYKTRTGKAVDFVVLQDKRDHALIQCAIRP